MHYFLPRIDLYEQFTKTKIDKLVQHLFKTNHKDIKSGFHVVALVTLLFLLIFIIRLELLVS